MFYSKANKDKAVNLHCNDQSAKVQIDHLEYNESHSLFIDEKVSPSYKLVQSSHFPWPLFYSFIRTNLNALTKREKYEL